jgi:hypothetical protein
VRACAAPKLEKLATSESTVVLADFMFVNEGLQARRLHIYLQLIPYYNTMYVLQCADIPVHGAARWRKRCARSLSCRCESRQNAALVDVNMHGATGGPHKRL